MREIRIIHTSDFHACLTAKKAAHLRALKEKYSALLIDTGDAVRAPNVALVPWREPAIALMNTAGYDAMGLGNREYFFRVRGMAWKIGHARFPCVCSNLRLLRPSSVVQSSILLPSPTAGGRGKPTTLGFFALLPTMISPGHCFEHLSDMRFVPWQEAAREAVVALSSRATIIAAGFHRPPEEIAELIAVCPEISLVLAGHAHTTAPTLEIQGTGRLVSFVGERASYARLIGLNSADGTITIDRLLDLSEARP
ncbi:MAG: hypothetical protein ACUVX8_07840 [Candidatus Zipacnadales bacterium]